MSDREPDEVGVPDESVRVSFRAVPTERGYRAVLLHLAALRLRFVPPALGLAGILAYGAGARTEALALFGGAVAIPLVVWGYLAWLSGSPSSRSLYAPVRYEVDDERITYFSPEGDGEIAWETIERWREAADHLLIYVSGSTYLLVPLADLDERSRTALMTMLAQRVGPAGRRARRLR